MPEIFNEVQASIKDVNIVVFLWKLTFSAVLGALLAFHINKYKEIIKKPKLLKIAKAQILICIAGTIMIIVIGNSVARAFGLFGIGSFIRFRTSVKNSMDLAIIFILIAVGMSVGVGLYVQATVVVAFLYLLLIILNSIKVKKPDIQETENILTKKE